MIDELDLYIQLLDVEQHCYEELGLSNLSLGNQNLKTVSEPTGILVRF